MSAYVEIVFDNSDRRIDVSFPRPSFLSQFSFQNICSMRHVVTAPAGLERIFCDCSCGVGVYILLG